MDVPAQYRTRDLVGKLMADYDVRRTALKQGRPVGPITGLKALDTELGGYLHTGVNVVQGAPGVGKTAMVSQAGAECGVPLLYVTAEMTPVELFKRMIARSTRTALSQLNSYSLERKALADLARRTAEASPRVILVDGTVYPAVPGLISDAATALHDEFGASPLIVIDSLQVWARLAVCNRSFVTEYDLITGGVRALNEIAAHLDVGILATAQRNRAGQERGGLHAAKGSGDIEYCSESVLELHREPNARPNASGEIEVHLTVLKNRHGLVGKRLSLRFAGQFQSFREA